MTAIARQITQVVGIDKYRIRKTGFEYFIDLHIQVPGELMVQQGHALAHAVKAAIMTAKPTVYDVLVHVEPV